MLQPNTNINFQGSKQTLKVLKMLSRCFILVIQYPYKYLAKCMYSHGTNKLRFVRHVSSQSKLISSIFNTYHQLQTSKIKETNYPICFKFY